MHAPDIALTRHGSEGGGHAYRRTQAGAPSNHQLEGRSAGKRSGAMRRPALRLRGRSFIPAFLRRPFALVLGYFLCAFAFTGGLALATWTISDPSLTFANDSESENWLGFWGASFADFSMQFLGFAAITLLMVPFVWGVLLLKGRTLGLMRARFGFWLLAVVLIAAALGCVAMPAAWPLQVGLGGVVGDAVLSIPRAFTGDFPGGFFAVFLSVLFAVPGLLLLIHACNLYYGVPAMATYGALRDEAQDSDFVEDEWHAMGAQDDLHPIANPQSKNVAMHDDERETAGWFSAPLGMMMHFGYSISAAMQKRKNRHQPPVMPRQPGEMANRSLPPLEPLYDESEAHLMHEHHQQAEPVYAQLNDDPASQVPWPVDEQQAARGAAQGGIQVDDVADNAMARAYGQKGQQQAPTNSRIAVGAPRMDMEHNDPPVPHTDAAQANASSMGMNEQAPRRHIVERATPKAAGEAFELPSLDLLAVQNQKTDDPSLSNEALEENAKNLEVVLGDFGVKGQIIKVRPGPVVTLYELEPAPGVKSSRVIGLAEDIARSMSAIAARVAVVPGRNAIGIELPNKSRETVYLRQQLSSNEFKNSKAKLAMCLGKNIGGEPIVADLAKMPHLLVAGTTGSGKSVAINTMILSLLYRLGPEQCKLIMIDPKMLELSIYDGIPHLLTPVVVDPKKAVVALKWTVREMEERYKKMSKVGVRNIDGFNSRVKEAARKGEVITRTVQTGFDAHTGEAIYEHEDLDLEPMPFIVVIIDEMADLMMVAGKDIEGTVQRLAQMARAAGIHVIMATQRPSVDVITGTIKANFPTRISFQVTSKIDSRTILGEMGAEQLLGMGDMLYMAGGGRITRVHGPFVADQEVEDVVNHLKAQGVPQYLEAVTEETEEQAAEAGSGASGGQGADSADPYDQAVAIVLKDRKASTSYIQRRLSIGYNRAASLIERMEQEGLISPANHAGKREILVPAEDEVM